MLLIRNRRWTLGGLATARTGVPGAESSGGGRRFAGAGGVFSVAFRWCRLCRFGRSVGRGRVRPPVSRRRVTENTEVPLPGY